MTMPESFTQPHPSSSTSVFSPEWYERVCGDLDETGQQWIRKAVDTVSGPLSGVMAHTGEPLDRHCAHVVEILKDLGSDAFTRASALLAVLPEPESGADDSQRNMLQKEFGSEIANLVKGTRALYRLGAITGQSHDQAARQ